MTKHDRFGFSAEKAPAIVRRADEWPDWYGYAFVLTILVSAMVGFYV